MTMITVPIASPPAIDGTSSLPTSETALPAPESEAQKLSSETHSVRLPPVPSRFPSVAISQPRSILKTSMSELSAPEQEMQTDVGASELPLQAATLPQGEGAHQISPDSLTVPLKLPRGASIWHTDVVLIVSTMLVLLVASIAFTIAFLDRMGLYQLNGLVHASHMEVLPPDWLELAVCFGPRLPAGALWNNTTDAAPPNVDDTGSYRQLLGGGGFDWRRSPFELLATPAAAAARHLGRLRVTTSEKAQEELHYTDLPLLLHYSLCRNFSGFHWSQARGEGEHWLDLTMSMEEHDQLLDGVTASFVDVFAYQRGSFSEFFTVSPLVPFRTDMGRPLRLRLEAELHLHVAEAHEPCVQLAAGEKPVSCLRWCLTRAFLRRASCTMPWMDALVFNMTALRVTQRAMPTRRYPELFSLESALPWMTEFAALPPCVSAAEFNTLFQLVDALLLYEMTAPDAEALRCRAVCPPPCNQLETRLRLAGGTLAPHSGISLLRIEVPHSLRTLHRRVLFEEPALLLELIGMLTFLFGASLLGAHDWCFVSLYQLLNWAGLVEKGSSSEGDSGTDNVVKGDRVSGNDQEQVARTEQAEPSDKENGGLGDYAADSRGSFA